MDLERWVIVLVSAGAGAVGWLFVGLYLSRRSDDHKARSAARAVYFELELNTMNVDVARDHGRFGPLSRATLDRLLPDVANWLPADELRKLVAAYYSHAGYQQVSEEPMLPDDVRRAVLQAVSDAHHQALSTLERRAFKPATRAEDPSRSKRPQRPAVAKRAQRGGPDA